MPGLSLAKAAAREYRCNKQVAGLVLMKHGLFTFGETAKESYTRTIDLNNLAAAFVQKNQRTPVFISRSWAEKEIARTAEIAPILRGCLANAVQSTSAMRWILDFRCSDQILEFVNGQHVVDYADRGTITPDHLIRTKGAPLILPFSETDALLEFRRETTDAIVGYIQRYRGYFDRNNFQLEKLKLTVDPIP